MIYKLRGFIVLIINKVIYAFQQQTSMVNVGVEAIIQRAQNEGYNIVIEGIHLAPGFLTTGQGVFHFLLDVPDEEVHRARLHSRASDTIRKASYYLDNLDKIQTIQEYLFEQAKKNDVPILINEKFEKTVREIINQIIDTLATELEITEANGQES